MPQHLAANDGGPQFGIFLLDLDNDIDKLQVTLDSLLEGHSKAFKIVVFTSGEAPAATTAQNTLHFVRVTPGNYVDKLNQSARQSTCDWLLLAEAGDEFTAGGLLRAGLELLSADGLPRRLHRRNPAHCQGRTGGCVPSRLQP